MLCDNPDIRWVGGMDIRRPPASHERFVFAECDIRMPLTRLLRENQVDTVIHCAFVVQPIHNEKLAEEINVGGAVNLLASCETAGIQRILHFSSATVYGSAPEGRPLVEECPLNANPRFSYARHKILVESLVREYAIKHPETPVTVLRPSPVAGRGACDPILRYLMGPLVFLPSLDTRIQITHVDDVAALVMNLIRTPARGVFNVGTRDSVTLGETVRAFGNRAVRIPFPLLWLLNEAAWRCHLDKLAPAPASALGVLRHPWLVDCSSLERKTGFRFTRSSQQVLEELSQGTYR